MKGLSDGLRFGQGPLQTLLADIPEHIADGEHGAAVLKLLALPVMGAVALGGWLLAKRSQ
jgi:hypothetical protein